MSLLNNLECDRVRAGSWMNRAALLMVAVLVLASAPTAPANQVTTAVNFGPWQIGSGGEFSVTPDAALAAQVGAYSPFTMNQIAGPFNFQTFCMERNDYISPNTTFDVTLNNITVFSGDPLSAGAAYLYEQFATGQLNYNYANAANYGGYGGASRTAGVFYSAYYLQHALWYLMNPLMYSDQGSNPYVVQAYSALGGAAAASAPDNGAHHVAILNLWAPGQPHDPQHAFQDLLVYTGVPEPSVFALFSIASLLALRRKK